MQGQVPEFCHSLTDAMNMILVNRATYNFWFRGKEGDSVRSSNLNTVRARAILDAHFSPHSQHAMLAIVHYPDHSARIYDIDYREFSLIPTPLSLLVFFPLANLPASSSPGEHN